MNKHNSWGRIFVGLVSLFALGTSALGAIKVVNAATTPPCIVTIFGQQYDVTSLQTNHTGGNIFVCGTDMTTTYQSMHGTDVSRMLPYLITPTPIPTATPSPTPSSSPTSTPSPTVTPTVTPTLTVTPTATPTPTEVLVATPTPSPAVGDDEENDDRDDEDEQEDREDRDGNRSRGHHNLEQIVGRWEEQMSRWISRSRD